MDQSTQIAIAGALFIGLIGVLVLGGASGSGNSTRVKEMSGQTSFADTFRKRFKTEDNNSRRKQIEETLGKIEERQKKKKKQAKTLEARLIQANWSIEAKKFMVISLIIGGVVGALAFVLGAPVFLVGGIAFVAGFGLPRMILSGAINRRQKKFTHHFADAMDIIVRGVRTGLPLNDCLKIIAHESPDPIGMEFRRVVEGESVGIPLEVCLEQLYERMPVPEVNFFSTVLNIQKTTGGNLGESLANLSAVLRGRKMLREKVKALSAEAKASAIIIGALPFVIMTIVSIIAPDYMAELFLTSTGQRNLVVCAILMTVGILIMRKMINFKI